MERLTHNRNNGIKTGYWSPNKKDELVQRLAKYEDTGLEPQEIYELMAKTILKSKDGWIPLSEYFPYTDDYIMISFDNFSIPLVGRFKVDENGGGSFYVGDDEKSCSEQGLFVNAWMPLPKRFDGYYQESDK